MQMITTLQENESTRLHDSSESNDDVVSSFLQKEPCYIFSSHPTGHFSHI